MISNENNNISSFFIYAPENVYLFMVFPKFNMTKNGNKQNKFLLVDSA